MRKEYSRLAIGLVVLFVLLGLFILYAAWPLLTGKSIVLKTIPYDPFDPFRGQYLMINYEITTIPSLEGASEGQHVYVKLQKEMEDNVPVWKYQGSSLTPPQGDFIKGKVQYLQGSTMRMEYGIEQYFFEKTAQVNVTNMTVEVKVDGSGNARIVQLLHQGKPLEIVYQNVTLTS